MKTKIGKWTLEFAVNKTRKFTTDYVWENYKDMNSFLNKEVKWDKTDRILIDCNKGIIEISEWQL